MADDWVEGLFLYRKKVTIDVTKVGGALVDYPMLAKLTDADLKDTANGGHVEDSNGYDIAFYTTGGIEMSHEIVNYEAATGAIVMYVKVPVVSGAVDTEFYIYYGNEDLDTDPSTSATWNDNYKIVHHCHQADLASFVDSSGNGNNGEAVRDAPAYAQAEHKIYKSLYLNGNDAISCGDNASTRITAGTIEGWMRYIADDNSVPCGIPYDDGAAWNDPWYGFEFIKTVLKKYSIAGNTGGVGENHATTDNIARTINVWYHVLGTYDGSLWHLFFNGVETACEPDTSGGGDIAYNGTPNWVLGLRSWESPGYYWDGQLEEIRLSTITSPTDYALTNYNNANNPGTFFSFGSEERTTTQYGLILEGTSYTVYFNECTPSPSCADAKLNKQLDAFEFWSDNYEVHDNGIDSQPLRLCGIEVISNDFNYKKFKEIWIMQDRHEEIEVTELGDCYNAVYVIKEFSFNTTPRHGKYHLSWNMSLEKVRDL